MTFVSYAQNFEDVMLWRALKSIDSGFYIDVGAAWPEDDSVTKSFYDRGWSGINIEPNPEHYKALCAERTRDVNLNVAVSDAAGVLDISIFPNTGLSTLDKSAATSHQEAGWVAEVAQVQVTTLRDLWSKCVKKDQDVHFLKVDVEGFEKSVLDGNDWEKNRPWIVVVEATKPMSQQESYASWEPILIDSGYVFAYADGLNRFYVSEEQKDLLGSFAYPPNVFDDFVGVDQKRCADRLKDLEGSVTAQNDRGDGFCGFVKSMLGNISSFLRGRDS